MIAIELANKKNGLRVYGILRGETSTEWNLLNVTTATYKKSEYTRIDERNHSTAFKAFRMQNEIPFK